MSRRPSVQEQGIRALLKRKREYERYFKSKEAPKEQEGAMAMDHQAQTAYTNIIKTLVELAGKVPEHRDPELMKQVAEEILEQDYGIRRK